MFIRELTAGSQIKPDGADMIKHKRFSAVSEYLKCSIVALLLLIDHSVVRFQTGGWIVSLST